MLLGKNKGAPINTEYLIMVYGLMMIIIDFLQDEMYIVMKNELNQ